MSESEPTAALDVPDSLMEQMRCAICTGFLSCEPVRVLPDSSSICGRCEPPNEVAVYRNLSLEVLLNHMSFPCRFKQNGCSEQVGFGQAMQHETTCVHRSFSCPLLCDWEGSKFQMFTHFEQCHSENIQEPAFKIMVDENSQGAFVLLSQNVLFIVKYSYSAKVRNLQYDCRYFETDKIVENATCKIQLVNNSDEDCCVLLKRKECCVYDDCFRSMGNAKVINLSEHIMRSLEDPSFVTIRMTFIVDFKTCATKTVDDRLHQTTRCYKCSDHLIPPLYQSSNNIVCTECGKIDGKLVDDLAILKVIAEADYSCRWRNCTFVGKSLNIKKHERLCQFALHKCLFGGCEKSVSQAETLQHYKTHDCVPKLLPEEKIVFKVKIGKDVRSHVLTFKQNTIVLIQYDTYTKNENEAGHRFQLWSPNSDRVSASLQLEHEHCKFRSKALTFAIKTPLIVYLNELPRCFTRDDELTVLMELHV